MSKLTLSGQFGFTSVARTHEEQQFYSDFYASVAAETLRGKVMNITSYIDESLIHLLSEFFPNTAHANKLLTNMDSCISTIMDRANMAYADSIDRIVRKFPEHYFKYLDGTNESKYMFLSAQIIQDLMHREEYAAQLRKSLPTEYKDIFDLSLEERQQILRNDF